MPKPKDTPTYIIIRSGGETVAVLKNPTTEAIRDTCRMVKGVYPTERVTVKKRGEGEGK